jgi:hypothetical protein
MREKIINYVEKKTMTSREDEEGKVSNQKFITKSIHKVPKSIS